MREQLEHLADLASRGVVELRVIPTSRGAHPCLCAPLFLLLTPEGGRRPNMI
ncbi:Scr1 family TA system antitoxin-like transcriptional regulator [Actinosynnema sp. NPDC004786]